jgi:transcriptional regulator
MCRIGDWLFMYTPAAFNVENVDEQHRLIRSHPLGLLISSGAEGLQASSLPFHLNADAAPLGKLEGHLSRANKHWPSLQDSEVLIAFQGTDAYVTPSWYQAKVEHGKVVPTWNYVIAQVRGRVRVIDDADWLRAHITRLTNEHEAARQAPWQVSDAPAAFIEGLIKGIIGLEVVIGQIEAKWKVSQNRSEVDRAGVTAGLRAAGRNDMASLVETPPEPNRS